MSIFFTEAGLCAPSLPAAEDGVVDSLLRLVLEEEGGVDLRRNNGDEEPRLSRKPPLPPRMLLGIKSL